MATADKAKLQYEAGQNAVPMSALTDSGDATTFTSSASLWSSRTGFEPVVRPNGLITGGAVTPDVVNNQVDVAALTCWLAGVETSVTAGTVSASRGVTDPYRITSITVNSGGSLAAVAGTEGVAFSETRGAAGGPPLIPVGSIEIAQVRLSSTSSALVTSTEIFAVVGLHLERWDYPLWNVNRETGSITFLSALPEIHTGTVAKGVYASYASPIFADVALASDFVPPETSHSVNSTQIYGTTLGSTSSTLGQGSFTAYFEDGTTDALVTLKNEVLWFKFYPDRYKAPYILCQGKLGIARTFPADDTLQAACTISAEKPAVEVAS